MHPSQRVDQRLPYFGSILGGLLSSGGETHHHPRGHHHPEVLRDRFLMWVHESAIGRPNAQEAESPSRSFVRPRANGT